MRVLLSGAGFNSRENLFHFCSNSACQTTGGNLPFILLAEENRQGFFGLAHLSPPSISITGISSQMGYFRPSWQISQLSGRVPACLLFLHANRASQEIQSVFQSRVLRFLSAPGLFYFSGQIGRNHFTKDPTARPAQGTSVPGHTHKLPAREYSLCETVAKIQSSPR